MAKAYVLIETSVGRTREVVEALNKIEGITTVDMVTGPYDTITVIEKEKLADIGDLVSGSIHTVSGIARTVTCLVV